MAAGIFVAQHTDVTTREVAIGGASTLLLCAIARWKGTRRAAFAGLLTAMGFAGAGIDLWRRPGPPPQLDSEDGEILSLTGCVVDPSTFTPDREFFVLELEPRARVRVSLFAKEGERPPAVDYGTRVRLEAKVRRPHNFGNPGAFDYVRYMARQDIHWTASARAGAVERLDGKCGSTLVGFIFATRTLALNRLESLYPGDTYAPAMMKAILLGDSTNLERVWTEHFRRTGTYHALVISGLHVIVLAGTLFRLLRLAMLNELLAATIAAGAAWLYAAVSGWSAPVVRAAGGFSLYLVGRYMYRRGRVLNLLSAVAIAYLVYDPGQLFEASFQLSFLSVAAIGAFADPLGRERLSPLRDASQSLAEIRRDFLLDPRSAAFRVEVRLLVETVALWTRIPQRVLMTVAGWCMAVAHAVSSNLLLSAVVQVALALPMAVYFHRITLTGLTANLIVVPLMSLLVPVGFVAIFTGWAWAAGAANLLLVASEGVARWHAQFEPSHRVPDPPVFMGVLLVLALIALAVALRYRSRWSAVALPVALLVFVVVLAAPFRAELIPGTLEFTAIDVGQGDALMLVTPRGKVVLVDCGGIPQFGRKQKPRLEIGEDVISPYLWSRRIQHVDVIATTHAHEDHAGGLASLVENFRPAEIWTGAVPDGSIETAVLSEARAHGIRVRGRTAGERFELGGAQFEVLSPVAGYALEAKARNNDSLVLRVRYGDHAFLLMGDVEREIEWKLLGDAALSRTTVLKVAHHGSKTSSTPEFLDATRPAFAVVSAGFGNLFRHPHTEVLDRFEQYHTGVFRTDLDGLVSIRSDGHRLSVVTGQREKVGTTLSLPFGSW